MRTLAGDGHASSEVRVTSIRTEIIILATRTREALSEKGQRIREDTLVVQQRTDFPRKQRESLGRELLRGDDHGPSAQTARLRRRSAVCNGPVDSLSKGRRIRGTQRDPHSRHSETRHRRLRGALALKRQLPARQTWIEEQLKSELAMDFECGRREAAQLEELRDTQRPSSKRSARHSRPWMRRRTRGSFRTMHCCGACVNWAFGRDEDQA